MADERPRSRGGDTDARSMLHSLLATSPAAVVVPIQAGDGVDSVVARVYAAGATHVQLIIPAGTAEFQSPNSFSALRVLLEAAGITITAVSPDPLVIAAARRGRVDVIGVEATARPPVTRPIEEAPADNRSRYTDLDDADADLYASFDDLSDAIQTAPPTRRPVSSADDDLAAQLDTLADESVRPTQPARQRPTAPVGRVRSLRDDAATLAGDRGRAVRQPRTAGIPLPLVLLIVVALIALVLAVWYAAARVTVSVALPPAATSEQTFSNEVIPYSAAGSTDNAAALQAAAVAAEADFSADGTVAGETLTPIGRAQGIITIINTVAQAIELPEGTDLIATNSEGREVRFALDVPAVVPAATTVSDLSGTRTNYGSIDVAVTARSPGSQSNVGQDAIKQILIPGQQPIISDRSNFIIRHQPIAGGSEEMLRIVTEEDVRQVLGEALTGLYNIGVQRLRAQIDERQFAIDPNTIYPGPADLATPSGYDAPIITPGVGEPADADGRFRVTVQARFSALATPADRLIGEQLQEVVPQYFTQRPVPPCPAVSRPGFSVSNWRWDGERLTIDGTVACTTERSLPPEVLDDVRSTLVGQTREAAELRMQDLQRRGMIGEFALPEGDRLPGFDWLIRVEVVESMAVGQ